MSKNPTYRHILKYTGIFGSIQMISMLASILRNKAAALIIDRYGQGISELFNNTINLLSTATTLVIPVSVVRRLSHLYEKHGEESEEMKSEIRVIRSWSVLSGLVGMVIVLVTCPILSYITFGGTHFSRSFFFLAPMLMFLSVNGTEVAILKATRRLKQLATASVVGSITTLIICASSYYLWNLRGIVISLDCSCMVVCLLTLRYTLKIYPYRSSPFRWSVLKKGGPLIKLSLSFLLASVFAALAEMLIRTFISNTSSIENVGLYGAGFVLTVTYTKFIFSAMDADYYPRLSGIMDDRKQMNIAINRQIVVCVLLVVPCLIMFTLFLPQIICVLYTAKYLEIIPMVTCATLFMFSRAINTPVAYASLAKGDSKMYLVIETTAAILLAGCVIGGYEMGGLTGSGIGLALSNFIELFIILYVYYRYYGIRLFTNTTGIIAIQFTILILGLACITFIETDILRYSLTILLVICSSLLSFYVFRKTS